MPYKIEAIVVMESVRQFKIFMLFIKFQIIVSRSDNSNISVFTPRLSYRHHSNHDLWWMDGWMDYVRPAPIHFSPPPNHIYILIPSNEPLRCLDVAAI